VDAKTKLQTFGNLITQLYESGHVYVYYGNLITQLYVNAHVYAYYGNLITQLYVNAHVQITIIRIYMTVHI
jgi:hypothetical protein